MISRKIFKSYYNLEIDINTFLLSRCYFLRSHLRSFNPSHLSSSSDWEKKNLPLILIRRISFHRGSSLFKDLFEFLRISFVSFRSLNTLPGLDVSLEISSSRWQRTHRRREKRATTSCAPALPIKLCRRFRLNSRSCWWNVRRITLKGQRDTEIVQRYKSWKEGSARRLENSTESCVLCRLKKTGKRSSVYFRRWDVSSERMCSLLKNTEPFPPVATVKDGGNERTRWSSSGLKMAVCVSFFFFFFDVRIIVQLENELFFIR